MSPAPVAGAAFLSSNEMSIGASTKKKKIGRFLQPAISPIVLCKVAGL